MTGIAAMLIGLIVLVLAGVWLSVATDKHINGARKQNELQEIISGDETFLQSLREQFKSKAYLVNAQASTNGKTEAEYKTLVNRIADAKTKKCHLIAAKVEDEEALRRLPVQFESYRKSYRQQTWLAAVGERHQIIKLLSGRVFDNVVIKRVTDVGLEISHQAGIARIDAIDLDNSWQQRFQWDKTQRKCTLEKENQALQANDTAAPAAPTRPNSNPAPETTMNPPSASLIKPVAQDLDRMRASIIFWKGKVSNLQADYSEANYKRNNGKSRSVPGSLESWDEKAVRVRGELIKAQASLQLALIRLADVSPNDPLLHTRSTSP